MLPTLSHKTRKDGAPFSVVVQVKATSRPRENVGNLSSYLWPAARMAEIKRTERSQTLEAGRCRASHYLFTLQA